MIRRPPRSTRTDTLFPYTTRFRSGAGQPGQAVSEGDVAAGRDLEVAVLDLEAAAPGREPGIQPVDPGLLRHQRRRQRVHHEPVALVADHAAGILPPQPFAPVLDHRPDPGRLGRIVSVRRHDLQIGRAACRERVCPYVYISVGAVALKKKTTETTTARDR